MGPDLKLWTRGAPLSLAAHVVLGAGLLAGFPQKPPPAPLPPLKAYRVSLSLSPRASEPSASRRLPKGLSLQPKVPKISKKRPKSKPKEAPEPKAPKAPEGSLLGKEGAGISRLEGGAFRHAWYLEAVQRKVAENWLKPYVLGGVRDDAVVYFRIHRDGRVSDAGPINRARAALPMAGRAMLSYHRRVAQRTPHT